MAGGKNARRFPSVRNKGNKKKTQTEERNSSPSKSQNGSSPRNRYLSSSRSNHESVTKSRYKTSMGGSTKDSSDPPGESSVYDQKSTRRSKALKYESNQPPVDYISTSKNDSWSSEEMSSRKNGSNSSSSEERKGNKSNKKKQGNGILSRMKGENRQEKKNDSKWRGGRRKRENESTSDEEKRSLDREDESQSLTNEAKQQKWLMQVNRAVRSERFEVSIGGSVEKKKEQGNRNFKKNQEDRREDIEDERYVDYPENSRHDRKNQTNNRGPKKNGYYRKGGGRDGYFDAKKSLYDDSRIRTSHMKKYSNSNVLKNDEGHMHELEVELEKDESFERRIDYDDDSVSSLQLLWDKVKDLQMNCGEGEQDDEFACRPLNVNRRNQHATGKSTRNSGTRKSFKTSNSWSSDVSYESERKNCRMFCMS